jgi:hypothetical protein
LRRSLAIARDPPPPPPSPSYTSRISARPRLVADISNLVAMTVLIKHRYNPRASLAIQATKSMADIADPLQCSTPMNTEASGWGPPLIFGAISCNLAETAATLFESVGDGMDLVDRILSPPPVGSGARFRQKFTLENAIGSHACSLQANTRVTNGIPLGSSLLLPVDTVNCVQTLKG